MNIELKDGEIIVSPITVSDVKLMEWVVEWVELLTAAHSAADQFFQASMQWERLLDVPDSATRGVPFWLAQARAAEEYKALRAALGEVLAKEPNGEFMDAMIAASKKAKEILA